MPQRRRRLGTFARLMPDSTKLYQAQLLKDYTFQFTFLTTHNRFKDRHTNMLIRLVASITGRPALIPEIPQPPLSKASTSAYIAQILTQRNVRLYSAHVMLSHGGPDSDIEFHARTAWRYVEAPYADRLNDFLEKLPTQATHGYCKVNTSLVFEDGSIHQLPWPPGLRDPYRPEVSEHWHFVTTTTLIS